MAVYADGEGPGIDGKGKTCELSFKNFALYTKTEMLTMT